MRLGIILGVVLWASLAHAQSDVALAKGHYKTGAAYYQRGKYLEAIREFEQSYQLSRRPDILYNLAQCHDKLGDHEKVVEYLRRYLKDRPTASDQEQVKAWLANLEKTLADKRAAAERAEAEKQAAERRAAADRDASERALRQRDADAGAAPRRAAEPRRSTAGWAVPATAAGAALVLFGVGGAFGGIAMSKNNASGNNCGPGNECTAAGVKQRHDALVAANYSTGFFIGGAVAAASAVTLWFVLRPRKEAAIRVAAGAAPRGAAFQLQGVW
jgi:tetratricopeptide (TPR) repeat protein